jgi:hypothetical protein
MGRILVLAWLLALAGAQAQTPEARPAASVEVQVVLPQPLGGVVADALRAALPGIAVAPVAFAQALRAAQVGETHVVVGLTELQIWQLRQPRGLVPLGEMGRDLPPGCRNAAGLFCLPWSMHYGVALPNRSQGTQGSDANAAATEPWSLELLALDTRWQDRLGLCSPAVDASPWLATMLSRLRRGERETAGFGVWTTLDARVGHYSESWAAMLDGLAVRRLDCAVLPMPIARALPATHAMAKLDDAPVSRLGLAVVAEASTSASAVAATALAQKLFDVGIAPAFLERTGLGPALAGSSEFDGAQAMAWMDHFAAAIEGKGAKVERTADILDIVFGLLFAGALGVGIWLSRKKTADGAT